jgi:nucleoside-diphosphate-sugar epimerase
MTMAPILVIGLSGQVGEALLSRLLERGRPLLALSRQARPALPGLRWLTGSLEAMPALPADLDTVLSLGPLDAFAAWLTAAPAATPPIKRVIALGSTGRIDKQHSLDAGERELAQRLQTAEQLLFDAGHRRGIAVTVLRPTLLYGGGRDRTVSRLLAFARRWGFVVLPASATGLRQPVHVADVADAVLRCLDHPASAGQAYDLPGGETLAFDAMVRRVLERQAPACRLYLLPTACFRVALAIAALFTRAPFNRGMLARLHADQLADPAPARAAFGYSPRGFQP